MGSVLNKKYPFELSGSPAKEALLAFVIVFLILFILQPFGSSEYDGNKLLFCLAFGLVTFVCSMAMDYFIAVPLQRRAKTWRIWHQALTVFVEILVIGLCNFLLACWVFKYPLEWQSCLEMLYWTITIGLVYACLSTTFSYQSYLRKQLDALLVKTMEEQEGIQVTIHDNRVRGNDLHIPLNDLLYIEAQKNNVAVYYLDKGSLCKTEILSTLASVLTDLQDYHNVFQCHRSFVVNVNNITSAKGNSNGYVLQLGGGLATVPVSRSFVPVLKSFIA
ncbi:MAG: LytTR family transcriptional regulator [Bacteroidales bacterium]|nr:LytTR family transcriptional regulator [Bacteroidales bacterium]